MSGKNVSFLVRFERKQNKLPRTVPDISFEDMFAFFRFLMKIRSLRYLL